MFSVSTGGRKCGKSRSRTRLLKPIIHPPGEGRKGGTETTRRRWREMADFLPSLPPSSIAILQRLLCREEGKEGNFVCAPHLGEGKVETNCYWNSEAAPNWSWYFGGESEGRSSPRLVHWGRHGLKEAKKGSLCEVRRQRRRRRPCLLPL